MKDEDMNLIKTPVSYLHAGEMQTQKDTHTLTHTHERARLTHQPHNYLNTAIQCGRGGGGRGGGGCGERACMRACGGGWGWKQIDMHTKKPTSCVLSCILP